MERADSLNSIVPVGLFFLCSKKLRQFKRADRDRPVSVCPVHHSPAEPARPGYRPGDSVPVIELYQRFVGAGSTDHRQLPGNHGVGEVFHFLAGYLLHFTGG